MIAVVGMGRGSGAPWWLRVAGRLVAVFTVALCLVMVWPPQFSVAAPQQIPNRWPVVSAEAQASGSGVRGEAFTTDAQARAMVPARTGRWEVTPGQAEISLEAPITESGAGDETAGLEARPAESGAAESRAQPAGNLPVTITPSRSSEPQTTPDADAGAETDATQPDSESQTRRSGAGDRVQVRVLPWDVTVAAGAGMLVEVSAPDGVDVPFDMEVDFAGAAPAFGGDWASRARLVELPSCVVRSVEVAACRTPVEASAGPGGGRSETSMDRRDATTGLSDVVTVEAAQGPVTRVFAVMGSAGGDHGSFAASALSPAGHWSGGDGSGNFVWTQEIDTPEVGGELNPEPRLVYSQHAVDGKTSSTNNQPSWVGEGWDLSQGFIERGFVACAEDMAGANTTVKTGDLCWGGDNATLSFGAHSGELIQAGSSHMWRLRADDGTRVEKLFGAVGSGDDNGEYWRVTTPDGTQYFFGRSQVHASAPGTQSTWTVPVFGNQPGEPCYQASFAASWCSQGWRWNLDQVVDPHGNVMVLYHSAETNRYGRNNAATATTYTRGGWLSRIEYGLRAGAEHVPAPAVVHFDVAERCLPDASESCTTLTAGNASRWPDVPFDQICDAASCAQVSPTFFTRKRLVTVRTVAGGQEVERWSLAHTFPATNDGSSPALWLASVTHAGAGGANAEPPVVFAGQAMASRVDGVEDTLGDVAGPFLKYRITSIRNGMGGETVVQYSATDCTPESLPVPETNNRRCFPVAWAPPGFEPRVHWFHTYVTEQVTETDRSGASPHAVATHYQYQGSPGWAWNDHPVVPEKYRNWDRFVGYPRVTTIVGDPGAATSLRTEALFYRGLDGDRATRAGGTKTVSVTDSDGVVSADHLALRGNPREMVTFDGPSGPVVTGEVHEFTMTTPTATNSVGWTAQPVVESVVKSKVVVPGGWLRGEIHTSYDAENRPVQVEDLGDAAVSGDEECTRRTFAVPTGSGVVDAVATEQVRATTCAAWPVSPSTDQVIIDTRTFYDGLSLGQVAAGNVTRTEEAVGTVTGGLISHAATTTSYDALGREISETDSLGRTTTTVYTPAGAGLLTREVVTSPDPDGPGGLAAHVTSTDYDPRFGVPVKEVEPGGETTEATIDHVGRVSAVWAPGRSKATQSASEIYQYTTRADGPNAVTTQTLLPNGTGYRTGVEIIDGLGRSVQMQTETVSQAVDANGNVTDTAGRLVSDVVIDGRGLETGQRGPVFATGPPTDGFVAVPEVSVPSGTTVEFDGAGRRTKATLWSFGSPRWSSTASYAGTQVHITPPAGETPFTVVSDARGNTVAMRKHTGPSFATSFDEVTYQHNARDELVGMTDAVGNRWRYQYDLAGNRVRTEDPDAGVSTATFDSEGNQLTTTNARGQVLATTYDNLDRQTSLRETSVSGPLRSEWSYDTVKVDHVAEASRWLAGHKITTRATTIDTAGRVTKAETVVPQIPGWIDAALAKTYPVEHTFHADGSPASTLLRNTGTIGFERIQYGYDSIGRPKTLAGLGSYVSNTIYGADGSVQQLATGNTYGQRSWSTYDYDPATRALIKARHDREIVPAADVVIDYTRNDAQQLTKIATSFPQTGASADTQCLTLDHQQRLTSAWTPASGDCAAAPTVAGLGGPASYWLDWTFDAAGNRLTETSHAAGGDTITQWTHPVQGPAAVRPHAPLTQAVTAPGQAGVSTSLSYDADGNTTARAATAGIILGTNANDQVLTWDMEGKLATATVDQATVAFAYTTEGDELLRRDATTTRLDLGHTQLTHTHATSTVTAERSYDHAGQTVAVRTGANNSHVRTLWADLNNTGTWQIHNTTSELDTRRTHLYGGDRGPGPTGWAGSTGFVQGTNDPLLGIVHVGARDYDPASGRFLSPDPVLDPENPRQWNAYDYGGANPAMNPDPTGELWPLILAVAVVVVRFGPVVVRAAPGVIKGAARIATAVARAATQASRAIRSAFKPRTAPVRKPATVRKPAIRRATTPTKPTSSPRAKTVGAGKSRNAAPTRSKPGKSKPAGGQIRSKTTTSKPKQSSRTTARPNTGKGSITKRAAGNARRTADDVNELACNCFAAGTPVDTSTGHKPIEDIKVGDLVWAKDLDTGESHLRPVVSLFSKQTDHLLIITTTSGARITVTDEHPFHIDGEGWVLTRDLHPGDPITRRTHGTDTITTITRHNQPAIVYNFEVHLNHNYYITTAQLLVHNCNTDQADDLPGLPASAPKTLGVGSTGRTVPADLVEQLAMTEVRSAPRGAQIRIPMGDQRWPAADGWVKMQHIVNGVNIHYVRNDHTGEVDDFKFKSRKRR